MPRSAAKRKRASATFACSFCGEIDHGPRPSHAPRPSGARPLARARVLLQRAGGGVGAGGSVLLRVLLQRAGGSPHQLVPGARKSPVLGGSPTWDSHVCAQPDSTLVETCSHACARWLGLRRDRRVAEAVSKCQTRRLVRQRTTSLAMTRARTASGQSTSKTLRVTGRRADRVYRTHRRSPICTSPRRRRTCLPLRAGTCDAPNDDAGVHHMLRNQESAVQLFGKCIRSPSCQSTAIRGSPEQLAS